MLKTLRATTPDQWLWRVLFILVPVFYNPLSRWQYEPDKTALVLLITALLLGYAIQRGYLTRAGHRPAPTGQGMKHSRVTWAILAYVLIRWWTTARSITPDWSLWGDPGWRNGFWITLAGVILFMLARGYFSSSESREEAVTAILFGSALAAGYGVGQYANPFDHKEVVRAASTMAHPNLLAAYLAMVIPLTLGRLRARPRVWWAGLLALQTLCLIFTYSRAGWLAALSGAAVWGIAQFWLAGRRRMAAVMAGLLAVSLIALLVLSWLPPLPGDAPRALQTLTSLFRWKGATAQIRLYGWEASLDAIRARPAWGYGPATFGFVLDQRLPPDLAPFGGAAALGRHTHNVYLEMAVESGLIGLEVYLVLLGALLFPIIPGRLMRPDIDLTSPPPLRPSQRGGAARGGQVPSPTRLERGFRGEAKTFSPTPSIWQMPILAALVAVLVNNFFSFDSVITVVLFWTLAGIAHAARDADIKQLPALRPIQWGWVVGVVGLTLAALMVVPDMLARRGEQLAREKRWEESVQWLTQASKIAPTPDLFQTSLGATYADWATASGDGSIWPRAVPIYDALIARRPGVADYHRTRALYFRRWHARIGGTEAAIQSLNSYTTAIRLSPTNPDLWLDRGLMRLQADDPGGALADFAQANALLEGYTRYYGAMSIYALASGNHEAAAAWNALALEAQQNWDDWVWRR